MADEKAIATAARLRAFLADDAVKGAMQGLERKYVTEWRQATTVEGRENAHAKMCVLEDFALQLMSINDAGKVAEFEKKREEKLEAQRASRTPRTR